jgi:hypothetical protein
MYSQLSPAATASTVTRHDASPPIQPLDRVRFEHLDEAEAVALLAGRFRGFIERGWGWTDALLLAVRPDTAAPVTHPGDASWRCRADHVPERQGGERDEHDQGRLGR